MAVCEICHGSAKRRLLYVGRHQAVWNVNPTWLFPNWSDAFGAAPPLLKKEKKTTFFRQEKKGLPLYFTCYFSLSLSLSRGIIRSWKNLWQEGHTVHAFSQQQQQGLPFVVYITTWVTIISKRRPSPWEYHHNHSQNWLNLETIYEVGVLFNIPSFSWNNNICLELVAGCRKQNSWYRGLSSRCWLERFQQIRRCWFTNENWKEQNK